jgi:cell division protein ZapA
MATVNVTVNGRLYGVGCEDGQEAHVQALAQEFDRQVQEVCAQVGQVGDLRLFLMAALVTADELADAKLRLAEANARLAGRGQALRDAPEGEDRAVAVLEAATRKIEALVERLG